MEMRCSEVVIMSLNADGSAVAVLCDGGDRSRIWEVRLKQAARLHQRSLRANLVVVWGSDGAGQGQAKAKPVEAGGGDHAGG